MPQDEQRRPNTPRTRTTRSSRQSPRQSPDPQSSTPRSRSRRRGPSGPSALLYVMLVLGISVLLAAVSWVLANDILALNKGSHTAVITITETDSFSTVTKTLNQEGIIQFSPIFSLYATFTGAKEKLTPGTYTLTTEMDYRAIISNLSAGSSSRVEISVTIPEGYTVAQIFKLLEEKGVSTVAKLTEMAATHDYKFSFLSELPLGSATRLEGYLFPDTYLFYLGENPLYAINKMLANFDAKVTEEMRQVIIQSGMTIAQVVTVASLIERETDGTDQALISSVIYNRLNKPNQETNGLLQIDATIFYVTGRAVTQADYQGVDSPYNTYLNKGLPPGPIANPGSESIWAAMNPKSTSYYYYALGTDNLHHFSNTLREHKAFQATLPKSDAS